ncbi:MULTISPECIES: hypothetical protein [Bacillaceae]|uniref:Uncharacterized protein n=1 Tax=Bacillus subtilis TaxID=1423 RepID=A0AAP1DX75_BACIU|nr:hypothetical protein [Bacillus subtilis]KIN51144.1 hypothetical protein B4146_0604 [Bacillus subtilis]KZD87329.1 hypothetical protein B4122_4553 [Bacillus subtilis]
MSNLVPRANGQKITYAEIEQFPEKPTELFKGEFVFMESEKRAILLTYIANFGLEYLVRVLPSESIKELKGLLMKIDV